MSIETITPIVRNTARKGSVDVVRRRTIEMINPADPESTVDQWLPMVDEDGKIDEARAEWRRARRNANGSY